MKAALDGALAAATDKSKIGAVAGDFTGEK